MSSTPLQTTSDLSKSQRCYSRFTATLHSGGAAHRGRHYKQQILHRSQTTSRPTAPDLQLPERRVWFTSHQLTGAGGENGARRCVVQLSFSRKTNFMVRYFAQMANLRCVTTARATQQVEEDNGVSVTKGKVSSCSSDVIWADGWGEEMIQ